MTAFDAQIEAVDAAVAELRRAGRQAREIFCATGVEDLLRGLPSRVGAGANPGIILRGDTFIELGNPSAGSCAFVLWTEERSRVCDGRVTLIGPDVPEAPGASLPFGQILLIGGEGLGAEDHPALEQAQYVADQIEGYMVRSSSRNIWSRVSKDAAAKGFCFETLGRALMLLYKSTLPKVRAVEIVFITSGKDDVRRFDEIGAAVHAAGAELVKEHWKAKGYDLDCDLDCTGCNDRGVCDEIRGVISTRAKKERKDATAMAQEDGEGGAP